MKVWISDLTHDQQIVAADVIPMPIGGLSSYLRKNVSPEPEVRLFKYPGRLIEALEKGERPQIAGFSNYIWNKNLGLEFAKVLLELSPETIIVGGGPNYPVDNSERKEFLGAHPVLDFYVMGEGEIAFTNLLFELQKHGFDKTKIQKPIKGIQYIGEGGRLIDGGYCDRISDIADIPSPYLDGTLDEFFDGKLTPIIQTKRGCPFACTFCVEGQGYYTKTTQGGVEKTKNELNYIAEHMAPILKTGGKDDLHIADSNYGMYNDDLESARTIADLRRQYGYPRYINVATGKNQKKKVIEVSRILDGAMRLSGAAQSLDPNVLDAIKRKNISNEEIYDFAKESNRSGANSYGQLILCLPNDTVEGHFDSIKTLINAGFRFISLNQLMMLPGSDIGQPDTREQYGMKTMWRVLPRCFGEYNVGEKNIRVAEVEEVCVELSTLSYEEYLECRRMHLMVFVFYNDGIFKGILKLLEELNISAWEWIEAIYNEPVFGKLKELVNEFIEDTRNELWKSEEELLDFIQKDGSIDAYINDELGSNIIFKYKLLILIEALKEVAQLAKKVTLDLIASKGHSSEELNQLVEEIVLYHYAKANKILTCEGTEYYADFKTNIWPFVTAQADKAEATESAQKDTPYHTDDVKLGASYHEYEGDDELNRGLGRRESNRLGISGESENTLRFSPGRLVFAEPKKIEFYHDETQQESLTSFKNRYGSGGIPALTRVLAKVYFGKAFRKSREIKAPNDIRPDSVRLEAP